jgi:hypothetical protein
MQAGEVRAVRELTNRVQATVCLGRDVHYGYANITIETRSPKVMAALQSLKDALREEAKHYVGDVLKGQRAWDDTLTGGEQHG